MNFDEVVRCVDLKRGYIAVGFKVNQDEYRERIRRGATDNEQVNHVMADALVAQRASATAPAPVDTFWGRTLALLPRSLLIAAIQEYTSTLKYNHCELALSLSAHGRAQLGHEKVLGIGLNNEEGVFVYARAYHGEYEWQYVKCEHDSMLALLGFAWSQRRKRFCARRMTQITTNPGPDDRREYFCAQFTMACLECLPFVDFHLNPCNKLTIDDIYEIVIRAEHTPERIDQLVEVQYKRALGEEAFVGPPIRIDPDTERRFQHKV